MRGRSVILWDILIYWNYLSQISVKSVFSFHREHVLSTWKYRVNLVAKKRPIAYGPVLTFRPPNCQAWDIQPTPTFTKKLLLDLQGEVLLQLLLQLLGQLLWKLALQLLWLLGHLLCCLLTLLQLLLDLRGPQLQSWNISSWSIYWGWYSDCAPTTSHNYDLTGRTSMDLPGKVVKDFSNLSRPRHIWCNCADCCCNFWDCCWYCWVCWLSCCACCEICWECCWSCWECCCNCLRCDRSKFRFTWFHWFFSATWINQSITLWLFITQPWKITIYNR